MNATGPMNAARRLSQEQLSTLDEMTHLMQDERWVVIGATALSAHVSLPRSTADVDISVAAHPSDMPERLLANGWQTFRGISHCWIKGRAKLDVVAAQEEQIRDGRIEMDDGSVLSLIGFDLAFDETQSVAIGEVEFRVPTLPVLLLLKMISWMDRPVERRKDLGDIAHILKSALDEDDERRWDRAHVAAQQ